MLAYTWMIPSADNMGRLEGDAELVASMIFPRQRSEITDQRMAEILQSLHDAGLVFWYAVNGERFLQFPAESWAEHQKLVGNMRAESDFPAPPDDGLAAWYEQVRTSMNEYERVPNEGKGREGKEKRREEEAAAAGACETNPEHAKPAGWSDLLCHFNSVLPRSANNPDALRELLEWAASAGCDIVRRAINESSDHGVATWAYARSCLMNWQELGAYTVPAVEALIAQHKRKQGPRNGARDSPPRQDKLSETRTRLRQRIAEEQAKEASRDDPG